MPYSTINKLLEPNIPHLTAAEAHGMAAGLLCINPNATSAYWLDELQDKEHPAAPETTQLLTKLFEETRRLLASDAFEFDLLLPDDDTELSERLSALKNWCLGFLYGAGCGQANPALSKDAQEILRDITEFTKLDTQAEGEEDEAAFVEITEYLRSAVMLLRDESGSGRGPALH